MNRAQACDLISQTFTKSFDESQFRSLSINILNHIDEQKAQAWSSQYVKDAFKPHVQRYERLGTYTSPQKEKLDVLVVHLTADSKLERARTAIRNFVADHLKTRDEKDAALVAFVSPSGTWRFSYVKMEYATIKKSSGAVGVETRLTPARRFSYIVGEGESCHTAKTRFLNLLQDTEADPTLTEIEEAFSVEAVTNEFFAKYAELFEEIYKALDKLVAKDKAICNEFTANNISTVDFAKKLMGQIVFLYFLQKKGWLGVARGQEWGSGPHDFLRRLAKGEHGQYSNFFNDILEPLFFDTLATDRGHEAWCNIFKCRIPFLNGGLFEPLCDYNWRKTKILLPNRLFMNSEPIEEGITGSGVLDIFDRYNFTVNEAEPLEKEVAIDPEMLGKVFENLLEENRRKGLGAYYTPREIVHYMCQQSLISHLDTAINIDSPIVSRSDIETFLNLGEQYSFYEAAKKSGTVGKDYPKPPANIEKHAQLFDEKLAEITICDPAVGSGAFPVGMMSEIVHARCALTPYFNDINERKPYYFKRHAIQNSLYGVDLDPGAVEITKLRLWLSLVVDEEDTKQIKPLPNLDYKIMQGNSLMEEYAGVKLFDERFIRPSTDVRSQIKQKISELEKEIKYLHATGQLTNNKKTSILEQSSELTKNLKKLDSQSYVSGPMLFAEMEQASKKTEELRLLHSKFFKESRYEEKERLKRHITQLEWELIETTLREENKLPALKQLEQFKKTNAKPFFLWRLNFSEVFKEKNGFDVVVANPPYIDSEAMTKNTPELRQSIQASYSMTRGNWDIYIAFYERGFNLLCNAGSLSFITPDKWISKSFGDELRKQKTPNIFSIFKAGRDVFESVNVDAIVSVFTKMPQPALHIYDYINEQISLMRSINKEALKPPYAYDWLFSEYGALFAKIEACGKKLSDYALCENACATSDAYKLKEFLEEEPKAIGNEDFLRIINTGTIGKYVPRWGRREMVYLGDRYAHPAVNKKRFLKAFPNSYGKKAVKSKLIMKGLNLLDACLDSSGTIIPGKTTLMIPCEDTETLKLLLAIVNSAIAFFYLKEKYPASSYNKGTTFTKEMINDLPIPTLNAANKAKILPAIDKILTVKHKNPDADTQVLQQELDHVIFGLYGLDRDEIKIISTI